MSVINPWSLLYISNHLIFKRVKVVIYDQGQFKTTLRKLNVIDTIGTYLILEPSYLCIDLFIFKCHILGFCDSLMSSPEVLQVIQDSVRLNLAYIDKVVIICYGRIEGSHVKAIKQFMNWLQFEKFKQKFVFIYNKSDGLTEAEKETNLAYMCNVLGADPTSETLHTDAKGLKHVWKLSLPLGFPPNAEFNAIKEDFISFQRAVSAPFPRQRIPVDKTALCTIL